MPVIERIAAWQDELTALRHDLHAHPEIGFEEVRTSGIVAAQLESFGIEVHRGIGKTGVVGLLKGEKGAGRSIGLRADMDALPMQERTNLPYASIIPDRFHGCGHDGHTVILLGAARYLAETRNFAGTAVFIFQPAEEGLGGARAMIADGLFEQYPCDEIYGIHNSSQDDPYKIGVKPGVANAAADSLDFQIHGRGGHAARPDVTRDPVIAAVHLVQALQTIVSRNVSPLKAAVLSVTQIHAGTAYNVVPEQANVSGTLRYLDQQVGEELRQRIRTIAAGIASSFEVDVDVEIRNDFRILANTDSLIEEFTAAAREIVGDEDVYIKDDPRMGSEDFSEMLAIVPGVYGTIGHGGNIPAHNPGFILDDGILPVGASLLARIVERRLGAS